MLKTFYSLSLSLVFAYVGYGQFYHPEKVEFGIGYFATNVPFPDSVVFYSKPTTASTRVAVFSADTLTLLPSGAKTQIAEGTIEIVHNDVYGFPILQLTSDSHWARVVFDCRKENASESGWADISNIEEILSRWQLWAHFFKPDEAVSFLFDSCMAFYSHPDDSHQIFPKLVENSEGDDYCMRVINTSGTWMQVFLETPSTFMSDSEEIQKNHNSKNPPPKVWIKYLDEHGRPRIWPLID
jgi:hypothetical protein